MAARPSEPVLSLLRDVIRRKGLSTAQVAERAGLDRSDLKRQLAGDLEMTIDQFIAISEVLEIGPDQLGLSQSPNAPRLALAPVGALGPRTTEFPDFEPPDALGNLPKQVLQLGFALGIDLFLVLDAARLAESGVPTSVLARFPESLPIKLDARFHPHNRPRFHEDVFEVVLSFDKLYTCRFPWSCFRQVQFNLPAEPILPPPEPPPAATPPAKGAGPHLRVIK